MTYCCVCSGTCNHVGPHSYCDAHKPVTFPNLIAQPYVYPNYYQMQQDSMKLDKLIMEVQQLKKEIKELMEKQNEKTVQN